MLKKVNYESGRCEYIKLTKNSNFSLFLLQMIHLSFETKTEKKNRAVVV